MEDKVLREMNSQVPHIEHSQSAADNYCLKCSVPLSNQQTICEKCAVEPAPSRQAKLTVFLLVSISFIAGFALILTA